MSIIVAIGIVSVIRIIGDVVNAIVVVVVVVNVKLVVVIGIKWEIEWLFETSIGVIQYENENCVLFKRP